MERSQIELLFGILVLLAAFGAYRWMQRRRAAQVNYLASEQKDGSPVRHSGSSAQ